MKIRVLDDSPVKHCVNLSQDEIDYLKLNDYLVLIEKLDEAQFLVIHKGHYLAKQDFKSFYYV